MDKYMDSIELITTNAELVEIASDRYSLKFKSNVVNRTTTATLFIKGNFTKPRATVSCGSCTKTKIEKVDGGIKLHITYKSAVEGVFNKTVNFFYKKEGELKDNWVKLSITGDNIKV